MRKKNLFLANSFHIEEMKKTVLSLQNSFSLILEDVPEVEA